MSDGASDLQSAGIAWSVLEQTELGIAAEVPRILLVDADADAVLVLTALLVPENQICHAATRAEAVRLLQQEPFALVVLDPELPDSPESMELLPHAESDSDPDADLACAPLNRCAEERDVLALVRRYHGTAPLLLYSARTPDTLDDAAGIAYLAKPWSTPRQLWHTISRLLGSGAVLRSATTPGREISALV
jgi:two-component system, OmpR family, phosphate regulon response regulator OmpR